MPDVAFWFQVMLGKVEIYRVNQFGDRAEAPRQDGLLAEITEETFDHVHPGSAGGREVKMKAQMTLQPAADLLVFVRRIVVHDKMNA